MKDKQTRIAEILREMESWNSSDKNRFNDGYVDFDGTGCFVARQKVITELQNLLSQ